MENDGASSAVMYVRTTSQPDAAFGGIRQVVRQLDSNVPVYNVRTMDHQLDQSLLNDRLIATLSTAFGVLATILAAIGLYGVLAFVVARRTKEIGLRMALGAPQGSVVWMVLKEALILLADMPGVTSGLLDRLIAASELGHGHHNPDGRVRILAAVLAHAWKVSFNITGIKW